MCVKLGLYIADPTQPDSTQPWVTGSRPNVNSQSCLVESRCCQSVPVGHVQSWSVAVGTSWLMWTDTQRNSTHTSLLNQSHRRRNRGGAHPPHFPGKGQKGISAPPTHYWAHTYLKIPPRSLLFRPHNSTVLTPNQSVRCLLHRRRNRGGTTPGFLPLFFQWRGPGPPML